MGVLAVGFGVLLSSFLLFALPKEGANAHEDE